MPLVFLASVLALPACVSGGDGGAGDASARPNAGTEDAGTEDAGTGAPRVANMAAASAMRAGLSIDVEELFWNPETSTEAYPDGGVGAFRRLFVAPCRDGSDPSDLDRRCPDGEPVRCADGTRPVIYFRPGTTDRWLIRIQNGGVSCEVNYGDDDVSIRSRNCWNHYEYYPGDRAAFTSSGSRAMTSLDGIYRDEALNPFTAYNMVSFDKCVGDRNLGDVTVEDYQYRNETDPLAPVVEHVGPVYFHGFRIIEAALRTLASTPGAAPFAHVAFQTHSNGSNGQYMYIDRLAEFVREIHPGAEVRGIATGMIKSSLEVEATADTSSVTHHEQVHDRLGQHDMIKGHIRAGSPAGGRWISSFVYRDGGVEWARAEGWGTIDDTPTIDQSCLDAHPGQIGACLDHMHVLLNHVSTPMFIVAQQRDPRVNESQHLYTTAFDTTADCDPMDSCCHDENYPPQGDCSTSPGRPFYPIAGAVFSPSDLADRVVTTVRALREGLATRSEMRPGCAGAPCDSSPLPSPPHGAFIDDSADHLSVHDDRRAAAEIAGRPLAAYLFDWLETGAPTFCVDDSGGEVRTAGAAADWAPCPP